MTENIEDLMLEISSMNKPVVYDVSLSKKDYSTLWIAYAALRADGRYFSVEMNRPHLALQELKKVLESLYCPTCHQLKPADATTN